MLADEITTDLRAIARPGRRRRAAAGQSRDPGPAAARASPSARITARPDGTVDTSRVEGVDPDLRVTPFFAHGGTISIREFVVGALQERDGTAVRGPGPASPRSGGRVITPSGMVLDGATTSSRARPLATPRPTPTGTASRTRSPPAIVDFMEFYLLNYFKPGTGEQTQRTAGGSAIFHGADRLRDAATCPTSPSTTTAAWPTWRRCSTRSAASSTGLFATADAPLHARPTTAAAHPPLKRPRARPFVVRNIFTDFKRHDLGPELPRAELRRHGPHAFPDRAAVGRRHAPAPTGTTAAAST